MNKKLYRSDQNKILWGICGGIGEYFNVDPVIIRIILVVLCLLGFSGIIAYFIAFFIVPKAPESYREEERAYEEYTETYR